MKEEDRDHTKIVKKKERKKTNGIKGKEKAAVCPNNDGVIYCKKTDGKGWHCKRPAQLPHNFCSYHIAQIRAYSSNQRASNIAAAAAASDNNNNKSKISSHQNEEGLGADSNFYYYYSGFGPWRGKRRGRAADQVKDGGNVSCSRETSMDLDRDDDHSVDTSTTAIAGDDEYDLDCFDDYEVDDDDDNDNYGIKKELVGDGGLEKKKPVLKKRGRKPMKSRSLKSLM